MGQGSSFSTLHVRILPACCSETVLMMRGERNQGRNKAPLPPARPQRGRSRRPQVQREYPPTLHVPKSVLLSLYCAYDETLLCHPGMCLPLACLTIPRAAPTGHHQNMSSSSLGPLEDSLACLELCVPLSGECLHLPARPRAFQSTQPPTDGWVHE